MLKYIVTDLDGTLLNENHIVSDFSKEVLQKLQNLGYKIILASGRHHMDVSKIRDNLGMSGAIITSNGGRVFDEQENLIYGSNIVPELVRELCKVGSKDDQVFVNIYNDEGWLSSSIERDYGNVFTYSNFKATKYNIHDYKGDCAIKVYYYDHTGGSRLPAIEKILREEFDDILNITYGGDTSLEVMVKETSKGFALSKLEENNYLALEQTMAFGDGLNDYEMLSSVAKGLVMGNASARLKELLPSNEVIFSNHEDAVAKYLNEYFL